MMIDANDQAAYAIPGGVPLTFSSAHSLLYSYDVIEFTGVTVKAATFVNVTLEPT
jgi:hypothetical protein